jgi:hypothetical protein
LEILLATCVSHRSYNFAVMIDPRSLPADFLTMRRHPIAVSALEAAAIAAATPVPPTLRALYEIGAVSLGGVHLFEEDLLDQYNSPAEPWASELASSDDPAERLLGDVYGEERVPGFKGTLFFASDGGGVLALVDGTNKMGNGVGAVWAISPAAGAPEYGKFLAADFDAFVEKALAYFRSEGAIDLIELARWNASR